MAPRRAAVLIAIHVLIGVHVLQWLITGSTLSPVEPSESMQTLRDGLVNAGFVMFALAIGSTLVVGRYFCGWACHVVALQDLCLWIMHRCGIKPKPFRSRVMVWAPVILAAYMFAWPVVHRELVSPLCADAMGRMPAWLGESRPWPGARAEFFVDDFWATFPSWFVAIPFLAVCGFACVYVLGAKGFCTYGCPYGGVFGPVDRFAPGRIRVNDDCEQCGHCTAVCTSNVRVHEEVRDFGMVVDPGCMKCMDCVSVCPKNALSLGFGAPAFRAKTRPGREATAHAAASARAARFDPTLLEDLSLGLVLLGLTLAFRGMFNQVPLLMAAGMGAIGTVGVWMLWRMFRTPNLRLHTLQLKRAGRATAAGWVFAGFVILALAFAAWSGVVRAAQWRAHVAHAALHTPAYAVLSDGFRPTEAERQSASRVLDLYRRAGPPERGGIGWALRPDQLTQIAYAHLLLGQRSEAEGTLREVIERGSPSDGLVFELVGMMRARGASNEEVANFLTHTLSRHPRLPAVRSALARGLLARGDREGASALWREGVRQHPKDIDLRIEAARFAAVEFKDSGAAGEFLGALDPASVHRASQGAAAARVYLLLGDRERAQRWALASAAEARRSRAPSGDDVAIAAVLEAVGLHEEARSHVRELAGAAAGHRPYTERADALLQAGLLEHRLGDRERALRHIREALAIVRISPWDALAAAQAVGGHGAATQDAELVRLAEESLAAARKAIESELGRPA